MSAVRRSVPPVVVTRGRGGVPILFAESNQVGDLHSSFIIRLKVKGHSSILTIRDTKITRTVMWT